MDIVVGHRPQARGLLCSRARECILLLSQNYQLENIGFRVAADDVQCMKADGGKQLARIQTGDQRSKAESAHFTRP